MEKNLLNQLHAFLSEASKATYAGDGAEAESQRKGFKELEYRDGDWHYRDSYTGFFRSWGQEVIWYQDKPVWNSLYGGGMVEKFHGDREFAKRTFEFLRKALRQKESKFQPRGPEKFAENGWQYECKMQGDIKEFQGSERIVYKGDIVFTHDFIGGAVI